jgi:hypothetical protein
MGISPNSFRPEVQARKLADAHNPEVRRRKAMWKAARGKKREAIAHWNAAWNASGRSQSFPEFDAWQAMSLEDRAMAEIRCRFPLRNTDN